MRQGLGWTIAIAAACTPITAQARSKDMLQPVQLSNESVRFDRGDYIIDLPGQHAAVQLRSMASDHDYISFVVAVLNTGAEPINVDVGNIRIEGTKDAVRVLTRAEMEQKAERRAGWAKFFTAFGGALVAASQSNQRNNYNVTTATPYGLISTNFSAPCYSCQAAANNTIARTDARLAQIRGTLDQTRAALGEQMLQLTTVDPGRAYGGRIFLTRFNHASMSEMRLIVTVGAETFQFGFRFAPVGTPTPAYRMVSVTQPVFAAGPTPAYVVAPAMPHPIPVGFSQTVARPNFVAAPAIAPTQVGSGTRVVYTAATVHANSSTGIKWHRYYDAAISNGASKSQAKMMSDEAFGSID